MIDYQHATRFHLSAQRSHGLFRIWCVLNDPDTDEDVELFRGKGEFKDAGLTDRGMGKVAAVCVIGLDCR